MKTTKSRKVLYFLLLSCVLCSCTKEKSPTKEIIQDNEEKEFIEPYIDENPIQLGLYTSQENTKTLVDHLQVPWKQYQDMISLETYYTKESPLKGQQKDLWNQYYVTYSDIDSYKIGYHITFNTNEIHIDKNILVPSDVNSFFDYIQIYLYDDIHQNTSWYSHLKEEEITETTRFTSLKLTASTKIAEITSPITITVFTYHDKDFDDQGNYRGNSHYQVTLSPS